MVHTPAALVSTGRLLEQNARHHAQSKRLRAVSQIGIRLVLWGNSDASRPGRCEVRRWFAGGFSVSPRDTGPFGCSPLPLWLSIIAADGLAARPTRSRLPSRARDSSFQSARRRARRQTSGKSSPMAASRSAAVAMAARPHDIEDAVDDLAHRPRARPAHRAWLRQVLRDHAPLCVGQIGLVSGNDASMLLWGGWRPHG